MRKDTMESIIILVVAFGLISGGFLYVFIGSDTETKFTNVESQSMQHSNRSELGIIDTGDMIVLKNKDKTGLVTYVEGYNSGYSTFGEYGNVVVYERNPTSNQNPVIHRLILYLEYNEETGHWSAPSLVNYPTTENKTEDYWTCTGSANYNDLHGVFKIHNVGYGNKTVEIDLDTLSEKYPWSGYLTMGDNASTNCYFDQTTSITRGLVKYDQINSVAWLEIPWGGILKMVKNGYLESRIDAYVPNSIPCMAISFIGILLSFLAVNSIINHFSFSKFYKLSWKRKE